MGFWHRLVSDSHANLSAGNLGLDRLGIGTEGPCAGSASRSVVAAVAPPGSFGSALPGSEETSTPLLVVEKGEETGASEETKGQMALKAVLKEPYGK